MNTHSQNNIQVECAENCGNSPKKQLLKELRIAFAKNEIDFCLDCVTDDVVWDLIGDQSIQGKREVEQSLHLMRDPKIQKLCIDNIITHGNTGSINGTFVRNDGQNVAFCDVYKFSGFGKNAKIKKITSYVIEISS